MVEAALERRLRLVSEMLERASDEVQQALHEVENMQQQAGVNNRDRGEDTRRFEPDTR
jgi:hypothetical protein